MLKRVVAASVLVLVVTSLTAPAMAKKRKPKPPAPIPVATSLFLHGSQALGELDAVENRVDGRWMVMDGTKPRGGQSKSMFVTNYAVGPNTNCNANRLVPTWVAEMSGEVVGDVKITLRAAAMPAIIRVSLTPDVVGSQCNDRRVEPAATIDVEVPAGDQTIEVIFPGVRFSVTRNLALMLSNVNYLPLPDPPPPVPCLSCRTTPNQVRLFYDSRSDAAKMEFGCFPASGATSCLSVS